MWEEPDANQLGGTTSAQRLTLTLGRFSRFDIFDDNAVSHDPRTQFLDWALMSSGLGLSGGTSRYNQARGPVNAFALRLQIEL